MFTFNESLSTTQKQQKQKNIQTYTHAIMK